MAKLDKSVQITLIIVLGVLVLGFMLYSVVPKSSTNTVTGNGEATLEVMPDLVVVYFNVETNGETSAEATEANSEIVDALKDGLIAEGFSEEQIQTTSFNVYEDYEWNDGTRTQNGYVAAHTIKLELSTDDLDKIGSVVDVGVNAGAGISYVSFELSQELENQYKAEALALAAEDAQTKAAAVASGLGKNLGKLVSVSEGNFYYYGARAYEASSVSIDETSDVIKQEVTSIQPSEQEVSASVTAVFKLS